MSVRSPRGSGPRTAVGASQRRAGSPEKPLNLIYVTAALPFGPEETWITPEIVELESRGHRVTVIPIRPSREIVHEDARRLTGSTIAEPLLSPSVLGSALAEIVREPTRTLRSALLIAHSRNGRVLLNNLAVFPKGLWLARLARRQNVDHIHAHFASTNATVALVAGLVSGIPWSFTAHRWDISENNLVRKKVRAATFARVIDVRGARELATLVGRQLHDLPLIHMGVPLPPPGRVRERKPRSPLRVLLGARFDEFKGHRYALEAVARLEAVGVDVSLQCAGDGPLKATIERYSDALGVSKRVHFPGFIDHQELLKQLRDGHWDVALLPSIETRESREGIPVFLIEAMAAGVPVVATDTGGISELLGRGAGMLIPQRDPGAIAQALATLAADGEHGLQLANAGARRVRQDFAIASTVSALLDEIRGAGASGRD
jgi:colanic acid/amylovoran biosynthesis glycosyltransferase